MSLRLESSPGDASSGGAGSGEVCTLELLGFRNDLARGRALSFLRREVPNVPEQPSLPYTVADAMDVAAGARLAAELDRLGAVVRLSRPAPAPPATPLSQPLWSEPSGEPLRVGFRISPQSVRLAVIIAIGAFLIVRQLGAPERILPPAAEARPGPAHAGPTPQRDPRYAMNALLAPIGRQIATGDFDGAQAALDQVLAEHDDATAFALQGQLNEKRGDLVAARVAYEKSVELGGENPDVFLKLSAIYRQQGMQSRAVDMLHRADQSGARGQDFQAMRQVVIAEQEAESGYDSLTSPHFAVSFSGGEDAAAARLILAQLEDAYLVVGHKLGEYPSHRTPVVLYPAQEFQRVTHSPGWAGALYDGRIKVPVGGLRGDDPELARTIRHEYAHSLIIALSSGKCPVWLNEGTAMWAEDDRPGERESWALGILQMSAQSATKLAALEGSFVRMGPEQAAAAYAQSYLAVRHLVARYGDRSLQKLIVALATSPDTAAAFREALPIELSSFEDDLRRQYEGG